MRITMTAVGLIVATVCLAADAPAQKAEADRLLEAELAEVASGDLDRAMTICRALGAVKK